jgi:hypothetical protein
MIMDLLNKIIAYENGELNNEESIELFQKMIDEGTVWQLQGSYRRTAMDLIFLGVCSVPKCFILP